MAAPPSLTDFAAGVWNGLGSGARRRLVWLAQPKFNLGVSGVIRDSQGRVLLLRHRFWKGRRWGLPGGSAHHGETAAQTLRREVREETGLDIEPFALWRAGTGNPLRIEIVLLARCGHPQPAVRSVEILEARFWPLAELPVDLLPAHRDLLEALRSDSAPAALPLQG